MEVRPDMRPGERHSNDEMIRLEQAWDISRHEQLRAAYDWLHDDRSAAAS
jgi:hypothetical protein